ncbi:16538_t:CDS:2 [Dentiscutata erythropus]|uniref:16538_t:CDS:1 n=1 Tax=Dentiscutata erythropus TaxID=1348616 RepID=A0A9N9I7N5_9GLOM|nr:16538_t:CDS:2 [Dentiscutata erythropus]
MCESNPLLYESINLQDLLMCESNIDDVMTMVNTNLSTDQSSTMTSPEFEPQIQTMLINNNTKNSSSSQSGDLSLNDFQYPVPSSDMPSLSSQEPFLFLPNSTALDNIFPGSLNNLPTSSKNSMEDIYSQETFLFSPNSANIGSSEPLFYSPTSNKIFTENNSFPNNLSPSTCTLFQDLNVSPNNSALANFGNYSSSMEDIFVTYDTSTEYDTISFDESLKKKHKGSLASNTRSKFPVIDRNTIKAILASLYDTTNRTVESSGTNLVKDNRSDKDNAECEESSFSNPKLPVSSPKSSTATSEPQPKPKAQNKQNKTAHNVIERRYRNNINDRINDLKNVVPALCHLKSRDDDVIEEVDGIPAATKTNKATILRKATEYIVHLKKKNLDLKCENVILKKIIAAIPGGIELYDAYLKIESEMETPPDTPPSEIDPYIPYQYKPSTPPSRNAGRVIASNDKESVVPDGIHRLWDSMTIDIWIITFLMCFTYIIWPSLFSTIRKPVIISRSTPKIKDATKLYLSLSSLSNISSMNTLGFAAGLFIESLRLFLRRFLGWDIFCDHVNVGMDERLLEVELWNRLGEAELCGGNKHVTRLSILYTCLRTINILENPYNMNMHASHSRIYANAALQCYVGLRSVPFLRRRAVSHFWELAIKEKSCFSSEDKWLEIALIRDQYNDILENVANRINDHIFHSSKNAKTFQSVVNTTVPLVYVSEIQALFHIKEAFYNLISERHGMIKIQKKSKNDLGSELVNKLKEGSMTDDNLNKQIIIMSLLSRSHLICGKIKASIHCADKAINCISLRKNEQMETIEIEKNLMIREIVKDIQDLVEFCVGWIALETRVVVLKIVGNFLSKNEVRKLPNVLVENHLRSSINILARYLRRSTKSDAFDKISKLRERFIRKLDALGRIISGIDENYDPGCDCDDYDKQDSNEYKATRALRVLKGM